MEEVDQRKQDLRIKVPEVEDLERRREGSRSEPPLIARPESWSVFGRPARRLFRVNCSTRGTNSDS
jgi:hypothetical protein